MVLRVFPFPDRCTSKESWKRMTWSPAFSVFAPKCVLKSAIVLRLSNSTTLLPTPLWFEPSVTTIWMPLCDLLHCWWSTLERQPTPLQRSTSWTRLWTVFVVLAVKVHNGVAFADGSVDLTWATDKIPDEDLNVLVIELINGVEYQDAKLLSHSQRFLSNLKVTFVPWNGKVSYWGLELMFWAIRKCGLMLVISWVLPFSFFYFWGPSLYTSTLLGL